MLYHLLYPLHTSFIGFNVFRYITFRSILAAVTAFLIVIILGNLFIRTMRKLQIGQIIRDDGPETHMAKQGVPTMGGLLILSAIVGSSFLWARLDNEYVWLTMSVTMFFGVVGALDDYQKISKKSSAGLSARGKLLLQFIGAALVGLFIFLHPGFDGHLSIPFLKNIRPDLGWFYVIFAMIIIVGASNAVNLTDGLDGLATGPTVVSAAVYLIFSYIAGNIVIAEYLQIHYVAGSGELAVFCGAMVGGSLGFLWFNAYPAQVFMGDVGALSLGAALGIVAVAARQELVLLIMGGVFVMETVSVILQVGSYKLTGKRIFRMAPIHHHFELKGWPEPRVIVRFWIITVVLVLVGLASLKVR